MAWGGEVAWVRISDKVKAAFTDDSVALGTGESPASRLTAHLQPAITASLCPGTCSTQDKLLLHIRPWWSTTP